MRTFSLLLSVLLLSFQSPPAPPPAATNTQAVAALQKALAALAPSVAIKDVTLSGAVRRIAGSDDETGTVTIKGAQGLGSRMDLSLPSGPRTEVCNTSSVAFVGSWSGPDGASHAAAYHNLLGDPGWSPALTLASLLSAPNAAISYVGPEARDGQSVLHLTASQAFPSITGDTAKLMQHLTQIDIFLDATTSLPVAFAFNMHPDNAANLDIPAELRFSDYRLVSGTQIPFHIRKFVNNSLALDLQFTSATINSGLSSAEFSIPAAALATPTDLSFPAPAIPTEICCSRQTGPC